MPIKTETRASSASSRQNDSRFFSPNFLVYISSKKGTVVARAPEELALNLTSEWDTPLLSSGFTLLDLALREGFGKSTKSQFASAQVWTGSSPIEITLPLEFYAEADPILEVVQPIVTLARMALPTLSGKAGDQGFLTPPGPSLLGFNIRGNESKDSNDQISIVIGNFLNFTNVIITEVSPTFVTRDMTKGGAPLKATCDVTFRTMFSLTGNDFAGFLGL